MGCLSADVSLHGSGSCRGCGSVGNSSQHVSGDPVLLLLLGCLLWLSATFFLQARLIVLLRLLLLLLLLLSSLRRSARLPLSHHCLPVRVLGALRTGFPSLDFCARCLQTRLFVGGGDYKVRVFALHLTPPAETAAAAGAAGVEAAAAQSIWAMTTYLGSVHPNRSSKKQRIRQLQFVPSGEPLSAAAATAAAVAASPPVLAGGLLLCCSGGSRIVDVFRCYNAAEQQQQQQKRERRLLQRLKKKQKQQEEQDSHDANQQQQAGVEEEEQQQRFGEVLFVGSLHADASIKGFHARVASSRSHMCVRICLNLSNNSLELWKANPVLLRKHSVSGTR